jgi:hypothetical protein
MTIKNLGDLVQSDIGKTVSHEGDEASARGELAQANHLVRRDEHRHRRR